MGNSEAEGGDGWWGWLQLCSQVKNPQQFNELFELFLTPEERAALNGRYLIIQQLLQKRLTQREISQQAGVSIAKITRGSNSLKQASDELLEFLKQQIL